MSSKKPEKHVWKKVDPKKGWMFTAPIPNKKAIEFQLAKNGWEKITIPGPTQPWNTKKNARILTLAGIIGVLIIITACIIFR